MSDKNNNSLKDERGKQKPKQKSIKDTIEFDTIEM